MNHYTQAKPLRTMTPEGLSTVPYGGSLLNNNTLISQVVQLDTRS